MENSAFIRPRALRIGACAAAAALALTLPVVAASAAPASGAREHVPAQLEQDLGRGLAAATTDDGVFVSWRLLGGETTGASGTGMTGADFALYRDGERIATVTDSTNYQDAEGSADSRYQVAPIVNGVELERSDVVAPWGGQYGSIPLQKPEGGRTPAGVLHPEGEEYTYAANDMSVADVDGDGEYEYVVKWYPSNAKDVSQRGYTGSTILDTYEADGTLLHRIDLGRNIRSGAHYAQVVVEDFDGDGSAEIMVKTAPGTTVTAGGETTPITLPQRDVDAGVANDDDYRMSADDYAEHLAGIFEGWAERDEVVSGQWPATIEAALGIEQRYDYPLSGADAAELADYFIDEWAVQRSGRNLLREFEGFILTGPEYLTVFDGDTGAELDTVDYEPGRGDDGLLWGDYAMSRIEPGNRVDRFLSGAANLDGESVSAVFARGYYTRAVIAAYDWDGERLSIRWVSDSGHVPMTNPFDDGPHGGVGSDPELGALAGQGFHSLSAADVDADGAQEIVYGAATVDDDGSLLYSSHDVLPEGSADPGATAKLGHGDAMHVTDIVPGRDGLEIFTVHEGGSYAPYGWALRDAATGEIIDGEYSGRDTGRGMIGDIDPEREGLEYWASMPPGSDLGTATAGTNASIRWAADGTTQLVAGYGDENVRIENGEGETLFTAEGTRTNNGTKGNPGLVADVTGDWREELLVRDADSTEIRVYMSTDPTDRKLTTLMHDPQYRVEVARQNTAYNQPSYTSYMLASDTDFADVPVLTEPVAAPAPEFVERPGLGRDGYVIPDADHVTYYVDGEPVEAGFHREKRAVEITAVADTWFRTDGEATWSHTFRTGR
ncbi:rhamnogalacturonan lyase [Microbacterium halophytorum]|uniref:rhamnogalacturonan lyase n=1 Tax=Microbacterium halophytorum TaxID=2067568 RepID=UPI001319E2DA|nr:rhamnogalacturonan lyase [Microbacterium halophytorum]